MTLALASRGYLCFGALRVLPYGPGPSLVDAQALAPTVAGSGTIEDVSPPNVVDSSLLEPQILGAAEPAASHPDEGPQIAGGGNLVPEITQAEDDD